MFRKKNVKNGIKLIELIDENEYWLPEFKSCLHKGNIDLEYIYNFENENLTIINIFLHKSKRSLLYSNNQKRSLFLECLKLIIESGSPINIQSGSRKKTPLHYFVDESCITNDSTVYENYKLIFNGNRSKLLKKPLISEYLLKNGAKPNIKDISGMTCLDVAMNSSLELIPSSEFIEHHPLLNSKIENSELVMRNEYEKKKRIINLLMDYGADSVEIKNNKVIRNAFFFFSRSYKNIKDDEEKMRKKGFNEFCDMAIPLVEDFMNWTIKKMPKATELIGIDYLK